MCFATVLRCLSGVVLGVGLASYSWAGEAEALEVQSFLGEPLSAWLTPSMPPPALAQFEVESPSAPALKVAQAREAAGALRLHLTSEHPLLEPVVQGTIRWRDPAGEGAMPFVLFLDPPEGQRLLPVPPGATLWRLAAQWPGPPGSTQAERMNALLTANPGAFLDGDPNRLRADAVLRLPPDLGVDTPARPLAAPSASPALGLDRTAPALGPGGPRLEVSPPSGDDPLAEERTALAGALARAEADRQAAETAQAEQAAEVAQLRAQLVEQREALARLQAQLERFQAERALAVKVPAAQKATGPRPGAEVWSQILEQAALGLSALALLLGAGLLWRGQGRGEGGAARALERKSDRQSDSPLTGPATPVATPEGEEVGQPYVPSTLVQRYGAQSLLSQRDWQACLDQVERAIAYGRLDEAEALLTAAREEDPHAVPLRLKVLELAVERQNRSEFEAVAPALLRGADPALQGQIEALAHRLPPAAPDVAAASALRLARWTPETGGEHD